MQVIVDIPDEFAAQLVPEGVSPGRRALEEMTAQAYREGKLTMEQVRRALGFATRMEVDPFLLKHQIYDYTLEDLDKDLAVLERLTS
jgi:hypothetical protein